MPDRDQLLQQLRAVAAKINHYRFYIISFLILALLAYVISYVGLVISVQPDQATIDERLIELTKNSVRLDEPIIDEIRARQQQTNAEAQPGIGSDPFSTSD